MYNQIYSIVDNFVKAAWNDKNFSPLLKNWNGKRGLKRKLTVTQVISLNLLRFSMHIKDLKASNKAFPIMALFMQLLLLQNRLENDSGVHFIDSTPVSTCLNRRIFRQEV